MLEGKLEFIPITEVKVFVSLSYFISKFPLYFATTLLMLLVPIPCIPGVLFDETKILFIYLGFLSHEFEIFMITKFEFLLHLNSFNKISSFFRSALLIPVVVPIASLICVWQLVFDDYGAINGLLNSFGFNTVEFFNSEWSMVMIVFIYVWKYCGFCVILFTAGIANVSQSLYESARLDGAKSHQLVTKITIPMIAPTTFFVFLMELIYSFKIFREVFALFGDYPNTNVYFLQNFINNNYYNLNYPRLSAASIVLSLFIIIVLFIFFCFERKHSYS